MRESFRKKEGCDSQEKGEGILRDKKNRERREREREREREKIRK